MVLHVDTKFPCSLPQDQQSAPCCRSAALGVYLFDLRRFIAHPTGDLRRRADFSPCYSQAAGKSRNSGGNGQARPRLLDDDAWRRPALGGGAADLLPDPRGHPAEDDGVRVVGLGDGDRRSAVGGLADLEIERHFAEKLDAEPLGFAAGAAMREDLAAAAAMRTQEIAHILNDT